MFAKTLETIESSAPKRALYARVILAALAIGLVLRTIWFARWGMGHDRGLVDFDAFYIVAQRVWLGDVDQVYQFLKLFDMQREAGGGDSFMPWTYPPQFDLLLAPFALVPASVAYFLFTGATLGFYIVVLRSIAFSHFALALVILFPAIEITLACGQNGFLTAGLLGLVCLFIDKRPTVAGFALGLMVVKPHLAIAFAVYSLLTRRWVVVMTAAAVVLASSLLCTAVFGVKIWAGFLQSVHDSSIFLQRAYYPLFRMISIYAGLRSLELPAAVALLAQVAVAVSALGIIAIALYRGFPARWCLGLTAMVSVSISPYAYDYDFLIFGMGLALLLPELQKFAREGERAVIYAAPMIIGAYGNLRSTQVGTSLTELERTDVLSIGGFALVPLIALIFMAMLRESKSETVPHLSMKAEQA
ncbi:MAG: DUF2029 domain-containing protein [Bradyrhizobium sp.]|uniref:glycosyltransferase family 87 protein n=1 Tax=Bradyrhizobium sp. TaxID=376 RepID=UPI0025BB5AE3|nr:glycosyltransferase family 87 protein [Bradyrhizobium sp.]MBI5265146.1 DUF2029 domain-containing protein [Bradyrhizobium sp.]